MVEHEIPECGEHCGTCARCGVEIKAKPKKRREKGASRRGEVETWTIRAPKGESMSVLREVLDVCAEAIQEELEYRDTPLPYATINYLAAHYLQSK